MDEASRRGIRMLMKYPWMVTTTEAIEIHRLMAEVLKSRSFRINWLIDEVYYDDGQPLITSVIKHLRKISEDRETAAHAMSFTSGAFKDALDDPWGQVVIFQTTYLPPTPEARSPVLRLTSFELADMPIPGATYGLRIRDGA